ncbi:MAG TPA: outer membrane protein assembly factor BamA [Chthoniobacterales bacterium]
MMRTLFVLIACASALAARAQTDAPPEMEHPLAPDELPALEKPAPPQHGKLEVQFSGATAFPEQRLRTAIARQIETIEEFGLDEANAYDAAYFLESFYRKNGYSQVTARADIAGPWRLRLVIEEGPLTRLGTVVIHGNKAFDAPTLTKYLLGPTRERFPRIRSDIQLPFVEADIDSGANLVQRLYASEGYLDAVVSPPTITFHNGKTSAAVSLGVHEGIQYRFGTVRFEGPIIFRRDALLAEVAAETKNIFTPGRLVAAQRKLEDFYKRHGYFNATVAASGDAASAVNGAVPALFRIEPGALHHFDGVTVSGTQGVKPAFLEKRLERLRGKVYDPALIDRQFRELIETGLFRNLSITPESIDGGLVRLDVNVEEAKPKEFSFGLGYATYDGAIVSAGYTDLNLLGTGRPLSINLEWNQRGYSGDVTYTDPWLLDSDFRFRLRLYALTRQLKGYTKNEVGFQPTLSRKFGDHLELSAFVLAKHVNVHDILISPESLVGPTDYSVASVGISQTLDYRNNATLPTRGFIFTTSFDIAPNGLSSVAFARGSGRFSYYLPITAKSSLAFGARGGILAPLNGNELPIDERFFNGGATTVRSFSEYTLGPKDHAGYPLGGQGYTVFNIEYTFPIYGDLQGAVFTDAGNVVSRAANFGVEDMRYAVGAGLRYNLPIGALRLDYGLNPDPKPGEAQGAFHFAIGVAF